MLLYCELHYPLSFPYNRESRRKLLQGFAIQMADDNKDWSWACFYFMGLTFQIPENENVESNTFYLPITLMSIRSKTWILSPLENGEIKL